MLKRTVIGVKAAGRSFATWLWPDSGVEFSDRVVEYRPGRWHRVVRERAFCDDHWHPDPDSAATCDDLIVTLGDLSLFVNGDGELVHRPFRTHRRGRRDSE